MARQPYSQASMGVCLMVCCLHVPRILPAMEHRHACFLPLPIQDVKRWPGVVAGEAFRRKY